MGARTVLFVCVENAGRSLMAEAIFNADPPPGWSAISGGTNPAIVPHPRTARLLREIGLELPAHPPRLVTTEMIRDALVRITMGCIDDASCPANLRLRVTEDWGLPDPETLSDDQARALRDDIRARVRALREALRAGRLGDPGAGESGR